MSSNFCLPSCQHAIEFRTALFTTGRLHLRLSGRISLRLENLPSRARRLGASSPLQPSPGRNSACRAHQNASVDHQSRYAGRHGSLVLSKSADPQAIGRADSSQGAGPSGRHHSLPHEAAASFRNGHAAAHGPAQARAGAATSGVDIREGPAGRGSAGGSSSVRDRLSRDLTRERSGGGQQQEAQLSLYSSREHLRRLRSGQDEGLDAKEALRRSRISAANKGRVPWNKGGSHRPGAYAVFCARMHAAPATSIVMHAPCALHASWHTPMRRAHDARHVLLGFTACMQHAA